MARRTLARLGLLAALVPALTLPTSARAGDARTLDFRGPAAGIRTLSLDTGVGDVTVSAADGDEIVAHVTLKPRRGGLPFFTSTRKGRRQVAAARIQAKRSGDVLELSIAVPEKDRRFEECWEIRVPARLAIDLDAGVGDVVIRGVRGGITVDGGVGDITIEAGGGDITVDAGVGDVSVSLPAEAVATVDVDAGVGDCEVHVPDRTIRGKRIGCTTTWKGPGTASVTIDAGVGDVVVRCLPRRKP